MKLPKLSSSTGEFVVPEPGVYKMELVSYSEPEQSTFNPDKLRFSMTFTIIEDVQGDDEFAGCDVRQFFGYSMHPKSNLYPVVQALLGGGEIPDDVEIDLDEMIGRRILGTIAITEKPRRDNPSEIARFANLASAAPIKKKKVEAEAAAAKRRSSWDDEEDAA